MTAAPDLRSLSLTERDILALLAQGHTAKTIAAEIGRSEAAVNERLREARRKTGVGSSRELARLVRAQECRDKLIEVADVPPPHPAPAGAPSGARSRGPVLMTTIIGATAAAALALFVAAHPSNPLTPPPPATVAGDTADQIARLRATFRAETVDPAWADQADAALWQLYKPIGGAELATLSIACRASLCIVNGRSANGITAAKGRGMMEALSSPALRGAIPGLHADVTNTSSGGEGVTYRVVFDAIWRRRPR